MSVKLKFVKGAYLKTYTDTTTKTCPKHVIQVHRVLRIKSQKRADDSTGFDIKFPDLTGIDKVVIKGPVSSGSSSECINDNNTLCALHFDKPEDEKDLSHIEVSGGTFSYPHRMVELPKYPDKTKPFGWIQVDFDTGPDRPVTLELWSGQDRRVVKTVEDGYDFDIAGYVMYEAEASSLDDEPKLEPTHRDYLSAGAPSFKVLEQGDGSGSGSPPPSSH